MYKYLLILCLTINVSFASTGKLVEYIVNSAQLGDILMLHGVKGNDAKQVQSYVSSSLAALGVKGSKPLSKDLLDALSKLPVTGQDANLRKGLQMLLDMPADKIQKKDVVNVINNIIYLANRHGKSVIITCAECVNGKLAEDGFKFTVEAVKNATTSNLLKNTIPSNPTQLNTYISSNMKSLGMGDYSKVTPDQVLPEEQKSLALFLGLAKGGTPEQQALVASIKKLSTKNGKTNIFDAKNPHKLWKIPATDMNAQETANWTVFFGEVGARAQKDGVNTEEAFYRTLKDKANGNEYLTKQYETLKAKKCFFK